MEGQQKHYRNINKDAIVQCPHPDCNFWYTVEQEDMNQSNNQGEYVCSSALMQWFA